MPTPPRIFGAPRRYIQGPGAFDRLGEVLALYRAPVLVVADEVVAGMLGPRLEAQLAGLEARLVPFSGEITLARLDAMAQAARDLAPAACVGIGGGKALDVAKGIARRLGAGMVTVPTIASNDSPTSATAAIYDDNHQLAAIERIDHNPDTVIVDTALIAAAPVGFLLAGIGDAIAKKFEADGCRAGSGVTPFGTRPLLTAGLIADGCYATLIRHGRAAVADVRAGRATEDVEAVVEATLLMSGLGFENGGLSLAHSLTRGLTRHPATRNAIHGHHISWGTLVQLAHEQAGPAAMAELAGFLADIGLPVSLRELGLAEVTAQDVALIAEGTMTAPHLANLARPASRESVIAAIEAAETFVAEGRHR